MDAKQETGQSENSDAGLSNADRVRNFELYKPGSDHALNAGCCCPVMDNGHGSESLAKDRGGWVVNADCPLHGFRPPSGESSLEQNPPNAAEGEENGR